MLANGGWDLIQRLRGLIHFMHLITAHTMKQIKQMKNSTF